MSQELSIVALNSENELAHEISSALGLKLYNVAQKTFQAGEISVSLEKISELQNVILFADLDGPDLSDAIMKMVLTINLLNNHNINIKYLVIPYLVYGRQNRNISANKSTGLWTLITMINSLTSAKIVTLDPHDNLQSSFEFIALEVEKLEILKNLKADFVVAADNGAKEKARRIATLVNAELLCLSKERTVERKVKYLPIQEQIDKKTCILVDDIVDSADTLCEAAKLLKTNGVSEINVFVTHGIFSGEAVEKLEKSPISKLVVTNTLNKRSRALMSKKIEYISAADVFVDFLKKELNLGS